MYRARIPLAGLMKYCGVLTGRLADRPTRWKPRPGVAREAVDRVVGRARLGFGESAGAVDPDREDHLIEVMRAVAVVVGVPPQDQLLAAEYDST